MLQAQIVPQYVNRPKNPQWANGSVKDQTGQHWLVKKEALGMFQPGQPANITYEQKTSQNGKQYNMVTAVNGAPIGGQAQQVGQAVPQQYQAPLAPQQAPPSPAPRNSQDAPPILSNVLAHAIEKGIIQNPKQLEAWAAGTKSAIEAFHTGQVKNDFPGPTPNGDPNDDIPDFGDVPEGYAG